MRCGSQAAHCRVIGSGHPNQFCFRSQLLVVIPHTAGARRVNLLDYQPFFCQHRCMVARRRIWIWVGSGLIATAVLMTAFYGANREPIYQGRPLSEWITEYEKSLPATTGDQPAADAVRQIGTNAIPVLMEWINYNRPKVVIMAENFLGATARRLGLPPRYYLRSFNRDQWTWRAIEAFALLGTNAAPAIPALTTLAADPAHSDAAASAVGALNEMGPRGTAALLSLLTNAASPHRRVIIAALSRNASAAPETIPALLVCLRDPNPAVRTQATNALLKIAPEVLTNAPRPLSHSP